MPTSNSVPSYDPSDLIFNAEKLDEVVNSTAGTYTDRMGVQRRTLAALEAEFPNAAANAAAAAASATQAANEAASAATAVDLAFAEATAAQSARTGAEAARDAALIQAGVYVDEPAGRAAVSDGQAFKVQGAGGVAAYEYRRVNASSSTLIATYPSKAAYDTVTEKQKYKADAVPSKNLFNPADPDVAVGFSINGSNGALVATVDFRVTGFIPVVAGSQYTVSNNRSHAWFDASKNFISGVTGPVASPATLTAPAGAAYFRISIYISQLSAFQIEAGAVATAYEAYNLVLATPFKNSLIPAASITTEKIAVLAVTAEKLADLAVTPVKANFFTAGKNKFNKAAVTADVYVSNVDGSLTANTAYYTSDYIPVTAGVAHAVSGTGTGVRFTCYFDANKQFIAGGTNTNISSFTPPAGAAYIRITIYKDTLNTFQVEIGTTPTAYEAYAFKLKAEHLNAIQSSDLPNFGITNEKIADLAVTPAKASFFQQSKNKFDKTTVIADRYVANTDGILYANTAYYTSDYIPVTAGSTYALSWATASGVRFTCYYDASKQFVAGGANTAITSFTAPAGAAFVRITIFKEALDTFQVELGSVATGYVPFGYFIDPSLIQGSSGAPEMVMPPVIYGVQGRECNVYFDNLHLSGAAEYLHDVTSSAGGQQQNERWTWMPTAAVTSGSLTVSAHDKRSGTMLTSATAQQRSAASSAGTGLTKKALVIGDSLINAGVITQTLVDIAAADPMKITLLGTQGYTTENRHEGRGGWTIANYTSAGPTYYDFTVSGVVTPPTINATEYSHNGSVYRVQVVNLTGGAGTLRCSVTSGGAPLASGTLTKSNGGAGDATITFTASATAPGNPFWIGGALNFSQYLTNNGFSTPDWVFIALGINDCFAQTSDAAVETLATAEFAKLDTLITSIKSAGAGVNVGLMIPVPPASDQDAFGNNYATGQTRWRFKRNILIWARKLIAKYAGQEASRIYLVPTNTALDTVNNVQRAASAPVNSRSSVTATRQNNGVHPADSGYQQIGDAVWAFLKFYA